MSDQFKRRVELVRSQTGWASDRAVAAAMDRSHLDDREFEEEVGRLGAAHTTASKATRRAALFTYALGLGPAEALSRAEALSGLDDDAFASHVAALTGYATEGTALPVPARAAAAEEPTPPASTSRVSDQIADYLDTELEEEEGAKAGLGERANGRDGLTKVQGDVLRFFSDAERAEGDD